MAIFKCSCCGYTEKQEREKTTIFGTLIKFGAAGFVAVVFFQFLAVILMACAVILLNDAFDTSKNQVPRCPSCGKAGTMKNIGSFE